jgi:signal peptidase I
MSDTKHDPFTSDGGTTPREAFERPGEVTPAEAYQPPAYQPPAAQASAYRQETEPAPADPLASPEPLVTGEPVPALAVAGAPIAQESRLAIEGGSLWVDRFVEEVVAWLKTLASAAVYATLIVTFGFQVARVEGQSMAPTLADQDRLIVNKLAYRMGDPQVGDIVMLYYPNRPDKSFVKRVIAAENDQVKIIGGKVYRNDVLMDDSFVPPEFRDHGDWGPQVIPEGYYFVMGDHRNNSSDSRHWGYVPKKYIIGKVQLRWWPLPEARLF